WTGRGSSGRSSGRPVSSSSSAPFWRWACVSPRGQGIPDPPAAPVPGGGPAQRPPVQGGGGLGRVLAVPGVRPRADPSLAGGGRGGGDTTLAGAEAHGHPRQRHGPGDDAGACGGDRGRLRVLDGQGQGGGGGRGRAGVGGPGRPRPGGKDPRGRQRRVGPRRGGPADPASLPAR